MLEVRDIFKTYENKPLLRGISFSVALMPATLAWSFKTMGFFLTSIFLTT
jgi:hypothetical protein